MTASKKIRVRFAPSPTGPIHMGGVRTALFNWIFAKANNGTFVLRIEDTDPERSKPEYERDIIEGLTWLGLSWDEYYKQSERTEIYKEYLEKLLDEGKAYYCFCTKEDLEIRRQAMLTQGLAPKYAGTCRNLSKSEVEERLGGGEAHVLRFKVPETKVEFKDMIRGSISFDTSTMGDVVIARDLNNPLYNFAVVIDDALTGITHVIRGEDHISNTPRQIVFMNALGFEVPQFAHLPIILNPDKSKMSKRYADTSLTSYRDDGYLAEALINFLAYLGWHPKEDKDLMTLDEIIQEFDISRVQKGGAVFDAEKLNWLNSSYVKNLSFDEFADAVREYIPSDWKLTPAIVESVKGRVEKLSEVKDLIDFYFELPDYDAELLRWRGESLQDAVTHLKDSLDFFSGVDERKFTTEYLEKEMLDRLPKESRGDTLWPVRVALSGKSASPGPFEIMGALGKKESLKRIEDAIKKTGMLNI